MEGIITKKNADMKRMLVSTVGTTTRNKKVFQGKSICGVIMDWHRNSIYLG
jgi:hypothetical protein